MFQTTNQYIYNYMVLYGDVWGNISIYIYIYIRLSNLLTGACTSTHY